MATVLNIVQGSTTIQLNAGAYALLEYTPRTPEEREIVVETAFADGGERPVAAYRNVSEVARVALLGDGSAAAVRAAKAAIDRALSLARRRQQRGIGDRVYVEYQPDGYTEVYRCELLGGRTELADDALGWQWADRNIEILIGWQRRFYWEGPEAQIYCQDVTELIFSEELTDPLNLLAGYEGLTGVTADNSAAGVLYFDVNDDGLGSAWAVVIYTDPLSPTASQVGHSGFVSSSGLVAVTEDNGSGLSGTLDLTAGTALQGMSAQWVTNTAGVPVYNHMDGDGHGNYVEMQADEVGGDLPAAVRLEITNTYSSSNRANNLLMAHNVLSDPANLNHVLEAEAASGGTTVTGDGACSGGGRKTLSWAGTAETEVLNWTLSTALLNACRGNYFRLIARFASVPAYSDVWVRWRVKLFGTTLWEGPQFLLNTTSSLQDMGVLQLPPYLIDAGDLYQLDLVLYGQRNQSGTHNLSLDFVQLSPLDGWRKLSPRGFGLSAGMQLVDDGIEGRVYAVAYTELGGAGKMGNYVGSGEPIKVWPNAQQRLYFLHDTMTGSAAIDRLLTVKVFYRPRRLTI